MDSFMECTLCARQPGSPTLCLSCQHNRNIIELQKGELQRSADAEHMRVLDREVQYLRANLNRMRGHILSALPMIEAPGIAYLLHEDPIVELTKALEMVDG